MDGESPGPGWWLADDGRWHSPESHPRYPMRGGWYEPALPPLPSFSSRDRATREAGAGR